jgi:hypothetical protein
MRKIKIIDTIQQNIGKSYCYLTVLELGESISTGSVGIKCACKCGNVSTYAASLVFTGKRISCGCYRHDKTRQKHTYKKSKHRRAHPDYALYCTMKRRCKSPTATQYENYGARGIKICERWDNNCNGFENFINDMGPRPSKNYSIDRIDVNGNYEPSNCRWATQKEQTNNKRTNNLIEYNGVVKSVTLWAEKFNLSKHMLYCRVKAGIKPPELFEPSKKPKNEKTNNINPNNTPTTEL